MGISYIIWFPGYDNLTYNSPLGATKEIVDLLLRSGADKEKTFGMYLNIQRSKAYQVI